MKQFLIVFVGSGLGGVLRYLVNKLFFNIHPSIFPYSTLIVNVLACFIVGLVVGLSFQKDILNPNLKLFLIVGFCGGFSTFSSFSNETISLFQQQNYLYSFLNVILSLCLCLGATFLGLFLSNKLNFIP